jgi:hypothetical protein
MQSDFRRHPSSVLFGIGGVARRLILPWLFAFFAGGGRRSPDTWLLLLVVPATLVAVLDYILVRYSLDREGLVIQGSDLDPRRGPGRRRGRGLARRVGRGGGFRRRCGGFVRGGRRLDGARAGARAEQGQAEQERLHRGAPGTGSAHTGDVPAGVGSRAPADPLSKESRVGAVKPGRLREPSSPG